MSEATIRVKLDTRQAKADLKGLTQEASGTASGVGKGLRGIRSGLSRGLGMVGLGGAFGVGLGAVQGALSSTAGGIFSESIGGHLSRLEQWAFGDLGIEGQSKGSAREDLIKNFAFIHGLTGKLPEGAKARFDMLDRFAQIEAKGKRAIEQNQQFRGPAVEELASSFGSAVGKELSSLWHVMKNIGNAGALHPMYTPSLYKPR